MRLLDPGFVKNLLNLSWQQFISASLRMRNAVNALTQGFGERGGDQ